MDKVKFGIIGVGNMGSVHLGFFQNGQVANGVCTAIADVNPEKLAAARKNSPGAYVCYDSGEELIDKAGVDAVLLAVPHYSHPPLAERAFRRGLHVLCEKPAGVYTKQVKEMNMSADKSGKLFTLMYNQRTNPLYKKMHEIVAEGGIGEIRRVNWLITNWFRTQYYYDSGAWRATWRGEGGGVLMNQCPHQLDLLQWICGMMPEKVRAFCHFGKWHDIETEDDVTAYLTFPNGATGAFITSTADAPGTNRFEILGSKGKLVCEKDVLTYSRSDVDLQDFLKREKDGFRAPEFTVQAFPLEGENPQHVGILNNFANAILGTEPLYVDGREGLRCVELIDAMLLSAWENAEVTLPIDDAYYYKKLSEHIADITEAVTGENPYEPEKTVESKFTDEQQNFYGIEGQREDGKTQYLGIPHYFGSYGIVYNKDLFDQKGYYFINGYDPEGPLEEKFIYYSTDTKTPGPDGRPGSDDDGLPTTYQEFFWLCEYIGRVNNQVALSWTGQYYTQYLGFLLNALVADYEGLDQMMLNYTFKGSATDLGTVSGGTFREDAQDLGINESNGWNLKRQRGVYEALSFIETLVDTPTYRNGDNAFNDSYSHLNNQEDFLMSRADGVTTPIAMTVDGMWWQSESSHVFSSMASRYGAQYSQENSELRWMPLPKATEEKAQEAADKIERGEAGNTIADSLYSLCFVSSGIDDWKLPIAVDFIQFCNTDESLLEFTTTTNTMKALSYEIGDDVLEQLSPYGQSLVGFIRNADIVYPYSSSEKYINNASMFRADTYYRATVNGATANFPAQAFHVDGVSAADYFAGMATYYERTWSTLN